MPRAIAFVALSVLVAALGVVMLIGKINSGLVNPEIDSRSTGAFTGEDAATPQGSNGRRSPGVAAATVTALVRQSTAAAGTAAAVLTPFPRTPGPGGRGTAVAIGEAIDVGTSRFTVHQVMDPETPGFFPTNPGNRRIGIEITQEAISGTVQYNFSQFRLRDSTGKIHTWTIANTKPEFSAGSLLQGQMRKGWLSFQLPIGTETDALIFQPLGQASAVAIVDLR